MDALVEIILSLVEIFIVFTFHSSFLPLKKLKLIKILVICTIIAVTGVVLTHLFFHNLVNLMGSICSVLIMALLIFEGSMMKRILVTMLYNSLSITVEFLVAFFIFRITDFENILVQSGDDRLFIAMLILFVKLLVVIWLKLAKDHKTTVDNIKFFTLQSIIPTFSIIFIATFINIQQDIINLTNFYVLITMLIVINLVQYIIYGQVEDMYVDKYENTVLEQRNEHLSEYIRIVENNIERIKMMKHDMKNNLLLLQGMMHEDINKAMAEIDKMVLDTNYAEVKFYTPNSGINALLNIKYNEAVKEGIDIKYNIVLTEKPKNIEDRDLANVLGNLLDNAIESCNNVEKEKYINFGVYFHKNSLVIKMENSTDGKVKDLRTRKKDKEFHGLGMKVIDLLVKKYGGDYNWYFRNNSFYIEILLWNNKL